MASVCSLAHSFTLSERHFKAYGRTLRHYRKQCGWPSCGLGNDIGPRNIESARKGSDDHDTVSLLPIRPDPAFGCSSFVFFSFFAISMVHEHVHAKTKTLSQDCPMLAPCHTSALLCVLLQDETPSLAPDNAMTRQMKRDA